MAKKLSILHSATVETGSHNVTAEDWKLFLRKVPAYADVTQSANGYSAILKAEWLVHEEETDG
jgi:hypothetical protein